MSIFDFTKNAFPYGLITYLLIDGQMPKFTQQQSLDTLRQNITTTNQIPKIIEIIDIDQPISDNLSGFNYKSSQGISGFLDTILNSAPNFNISGGLNYGYRYHSKGPHARWR